MTLFLSIASVMFMACAAVVLWPLWRTGAAGSGRRREANVTIYHQRYDEIEREVAEQRITRAQAEQRKDELGARLLADVDAEPEARIAASDSRPWLTSAVVVVAIGGIAFGLYGLTGDPRGLQPPTSPDIAELTARLEARVAAAPNDLEARSLLARLQFTRGQHVAAAQSYAAINARMDTPQPQYLLAEARARVRSQNGAMTDPALALYERVLELSPDNVEALWYMGVARLADGNEAAAANYWTRLLEQTLPDDFRATVEQRLAELRGDKPRLRAPD